MGKEKKIQLPDLPKGEYYEDFVAALLCAGGYYIEKRINLREPTNILELDVVTSKYYSDHDEKRLSEIKSAGWGLSDVFKVRGWLDFLKLPEASFVCLNTDKKDFTEMQQVAKELNIDLVEIKIKKNIIEKDDLLKAYNIKISNSNLYDCAVTSIRFALCCERIMLNLYFKPLVKNPKAPCSYKKAEEFLCKVSDHSFFQNNAYERLKEVFGAFTLFRNLTAKMDTEMLTGEYPDIDNVALSQNSYDKIYYNPDDKSPLHVALYAELMCRITMLQLCVEESFRDKELQGMKKILENLSLPNNIRDGIVNLQSSHRYYYSYPHFWQIFIYVFGGFILDEKKNEEYKMLSELTNIPIEEIPNALTAFDILFPLEPNNSWFLLTRDIQNFSN